MAVQQRQTFSGWQRKSFLLLIVLGCLSPFIYADEHPLPPFIALEDESSSVLSLSGSAVRKQFFLKIYTLAHYMDWSFWDENEASSPSLEALLPQVLSGEHWQQIDIVFERDLRAEQIKNALVDGIKRNSTFEQYKKVSDTLSAFKQGITQDVSKGTHFRLRWQPDGRLLAVYESQIIIDIVDPLFARQLWSVWFGERAVIDKKDILSERLGVETKE